MQSVWIGLSALSKERTGGLIDGSKRVTFVGFGIVDVNGARIDVVIVIPSGGDVDAFNTDTAGAEASGEGGGDPSSSSSLIISMRVRRRCSFFAVAGVGAKNSNSSIAVA